tara:strand:+ start:1192 stop:1470 length:279 start_codon:yes stop_codon:yes gene_type:complete
MAAFRAAAVTARGVKGGGGGAVVDSIRAPLLLTVSSIPETSIGSCKTYTFSEEERKRWRLEMPSACAVCSRSLRASTLSTHSASGNAGTGGG